MISDIYILSMTLYRPYEGEGSFSNYVEAEFPTRINNILPGYITFKSIEYKQDEIISSLLYSFLYRMVSDGLKELLAQMEIELGFYHIRLESQEDLCRKELPSIEFIFQKLHEEYSFISSYFFYLAEDGLKYFVKLWTFESDVEEEEAEDEIDDIVFYSELVDSYFYKSVIPDEYLDEIAKWMLLMESI